MSEEGPNQYGYIVRLDKPKNDSKGTHGWQVRLPTGTPRKYTSKLFSDNIYGSKGKALVAAEEYLEELRAKHPYISQRPEIFFRKKATARNTSGRNGVYRTYAYFTRDKDKKIRHYYWGAFCPLGPNGQRNKWSKRFYIETHGEEEAKRRAIEFREMWEEAAEQGKEAVKRFFAAHHDGWL
jgi:hypothetical protein